jgi:hypothetical protein
MKKCLSNTHHASPLLFEKRGEIEKRKGGEVGELERETWCVAKR